MPTQSPAPLEPGRCLLFAYGQLQPGLRPPRTVRRAWQDRVMGELFDLETYPAAVRVGAADRWIWGYVMEIDESELLAELDVYEEVAGGLYRRIRTTTESGVAVWIYEYARPLPPHAKGPIERWPDQAKHE